MAGSVSLYNTFGNEVKTTVLQDTLVNYLENATIKFALPEASTELLTTLTTIKADGINPTELDQVTQQLVSMGFGEANARTLAIVLIKVAQANNISPQEYFNLNNSTLQLVLETYNLINKYRPVGNRVGVVLPIDNMKSPAGVLIKP